MRELPELLFAIYALALPRGHGFGNKPPIEFWTSEKERAVGVVRKDVGDGDISVLAMRRRTDSVWTVVADGGGLGSHEAARARLTELLVDEPPEPLPPGVIARPALHDLQGRTPSDVFKVLAQPTHTVAAWLLNQIYLALPNPDRNWAADCQTGNFHTRLWEAQLLASFREQGLLVAQPELSPDFRIENRKGGEAWVEAVTANPPVPYNHAKSQPSSPPTERREIFLGPAALRFAKTLGNKLQRRYDQLPHVAGKPFALALADFQAPSSMVWSREALVGYLYGMHADVIEENGSKRAVAIPAATLLGEAGFPAGLFTDDRSAELSAVIFTNACSIAKLNRVGITAGASAPGYRYTRFGKFFDRTPGALEGIPFCMDIQSTEYRKLWGVGSEPWSAELEVFHNPHARHPLPRELLPEATHWFERGGEMVCDAYYETSILWSRTVIQDESDPPLTLDDLSSQAQAEANDSSPEDAP